MRRNAGASADADASRVEAVVSPNTTDISYTSRGSPWIHLPGSALRNRVVPVFSRPTTICGSRCNNYLYRSAAPCRT
jgi:hypothetical protein